MHTCRADFTKAEEHLVKALEAAKTVGDLKSLEQSQVFLAMVYFLRGDLVQSTETLNTAYESATLRGDIQNTILAELGLARNYYALEDTEMCLESISNISVALESFSDIAVELEYYGLRALSNLRDGQIDQALEVANIALVKARNSEPLMYINFVGYSSMCEVFLTVACQTNDKVTKKNLLSKAEESFNLLKQFAKSFLFAKPREALWNGLMNFCNGKGNKSSKDWSTAVELAKNFGMRHEEEVFVAKYFPEFKRLMQVIK